MIIGKGCFAIVIMTTSVLPVFTLVWEGEISVGSSVELRQVLLGISS